MVKYTLHTLANMKQTLTPETMKTKQVEQIKQNLLKAFVNLTTYGKVKKRVFLNGADQFRHAMYMQNMLSDDENEALTFMIRAERDKYR